MATNDKPDELYPERKDIEVSELAPAMDQDELQLVTYFTGDARWTGGGLSLHAVVRRIVRDDSRSWRYTPERLWAPSSDLSLYRDAHGSRSLLNLSGPSSAFFVAFSPCSLRYGGTIPSR